MPHDRKLVGLDKLSPKIRGALPPKKLGGQNMQNFRRFGTTSDFDRNISGTAEDIQNRPTLQPMAIPPALDEKSRVNFGPLTAWNYM